MSPPSLRPALDGRSQPRRGSARPSRSTPSRPSARSGSRPKKQSQMSKEIRSCCLEVSPRSGACRLPHFRRLGSGGHIQKFRGRTAASVSRGGHAQRRAGQVNRVETTVMSTDSSRQKQLGVCILRPDHATPSAAIRPKAKTSLVGSRAEEAETSKGSCSGICDCLDCSPLLNPASPSEHSPSAPPEIDVRVPPINRLGHQFNSESSTCNH